MSREPAFQVRDPDFERSVRESFARQRIMQTFGAELEAVGPGRVTISMPFSEKLAQQHGYLHAGAMATVLDSACGYAALTLMPKGSGVVSVEFKISMLAPAKGRALLATAEVVRSGRTITFCEAEAVMDGVEPGASAIPVATMTGTMMRIERRPGIEG